MAHFAELNSSNEVLRVVVISNDDVDANGGDLHADAETFVASIVPYSTGGTAWKQTSYNSIGEPLLVYHTLLKNDHVVVKNDHVVATLCINKQWCN